ncbi:MAG TPA: GNAT family N-acetyltransferase [Chitinophagaceae bacterium]|nr:GNAT family N-acetyltransferase [Chitinophagaceae bacterium]
MKIILETERLYLRQFTTDDSAFILELVNTEGWLRYIGNRNISNLEQAQNYLVNGPIKSYQTYGYGLCMVQLKSSNEAAGMCGFIKRDTLENIDLGFAFLPQFTGNGYAFETAKMTVNYGFEQLQQKKIAAITLPQNDRSIRLLNKLGFVYEQNIHPEDSKEDLLLFGLDKERYIQMNAGTF